MSKDLPSILNQFPKAIPDDDIEEVMVAGRWIKIQAGTYRDSGTLVSFRSPDGTLYNTQPKFVQLQRGPRSNG